MRVLIVGGGGREHALAWKLSLSPLRPELHAAPGNAGIAELATCHEVAATDLDAQVSLARRLNVDLVVVGPDDPLALGLVDRLQAAGILAFGPTAAAARLEASKAFAKDVMQAAGIPTARYQSFTDHAAARSYLSEVGAPVVVKADGLALGKGVFVCDTRAAAEAALQSVMVDGVLGEAGRTVVIEEYLEGPECSVLALCDGDHFATFPAIQDHKRIGEGDTGPNTGGMGTYTPVPDCPPELVQEIGERVIAPALAEMRRRGTPFQGCLFSGLMLTRAGLKVLEFNARFGDPETQVALPMLQDDLLELLLACARGAMGPRPLAWAGGACACVVLASGGYPGAYAKGKPISGQTEAGATGALLFHAGTAWRDGRVVTAGGRVIGVVGRGASLRAALNQAYAGADALQFEGKYLRRDIAWRALGSSR